MQVISREDVTRVVRDDMEYLSDRELAEWITDLVLQLCNHDNDLKQSVVDNVKQMQEDDDA